MIKNAWAMIFADWKMTNDNKMANKKYFEWWMINDKWWMMNDEWWMMNDEWLMQGFRMEKVD